MVTAWATGEKGERVLLLGLTHTNVKRLRRGEPIRVTSESHPGFPEDIRVLIICDANERAIVDKIKQFIGTDTKVITVPRDPQGRTS